MNDEHQTAHRVTLRVNKLLGPGGSGTSLYVHIDAIGPGGRRRRVHSEPIGGYLRDSSYDRVISVSVAEDFGQVSGFELACSAEPDAEVDVVLVGG